MQGNKAMNKSQLEDELVRVRADATAERNKAYTRGQKIEGLEKDLTNSQDSMLYHKEIAARQGGEIDTLKMVLDRLLPEATS